MFEGPEDERMDTNGVPRRICLSVEVEPDLHRRVEIAAAERDMKIEDFVVRVLEDVAGPERERHDDGASDCEAGEELAHISAAAFARDWDSEEDSVYDELTP